MAPARCPTFPGHVCMHFVVFRNMNPTTTKGSLDDQKNGLEKRVAERSVELAGAREKLQAVLDAATHVSIIATDTQGLITVFNHGAEQMLGYSADEMVGRQSPANIHLESEVLARGRELTKEMGKP